jgi:hypothetical protein
MSKWSQELENQNPKKLKKKERNNGYTIKMILIASK